MPKPVLTISTVAILLALTAVTTYTYLLYQHSQAQASTIKVQEVQLKSNTEGLRTLETSIQRLSAQMAQQTSTAIAQRKKDQARILSLSDQLRNAKATNQELNSNNSDLAARLDTSNGRNQDLTNQVSTLTEETRTLNASLDDSTAENLSLNNEIDTLKSKSQELSQELLQVYHLNTEQRDKLDSAEQRITRLQTNNRNLQSSLTSAERNLTRLQQSAGSLDSINNQKNILEREVSRLQEEIKSLEEKRKPLTLDTYVSNLSCTASMEPKLTCLDTVTMLTNFHPADIVPGTIIGFTPNRSCNIESSSVLHRVTKVKQIHDKYYYWPKGDNNREPDNCWIHEHDVHAYVIGVQKNVNRHLSNLRNGVNNAIQNEENAWASYSRAYARYCGFSPDANRHCELQDSHYNIVIDLYNEHNLAFSRLECWLNNARRINADSNFLLAPCF